MDVGDRSGTRGATCASRHLGPEDARGQCWCSWSLSSISSVSSISSRLGHGPGSANGLRDELPTRVPDRGNTLSRGTAVATACDLSKVHSCARWYTMDALPTKAAGRWNEKWIWSDSCVTCLVFLRQSGVPR